VLYVYRPAGSQSARALSTALGARRIKRLPKLTSKDTVICWGASLSGPARVVNGGTLRSKLSDAIVLKKAGVPTIEVSTASRPGWLGRSASHVGGNDLLKPPRQPDYWVKKEEFVKEFRVHSFHGRSIRSGIKKHRADFEKPHEWIRSWDAGWRVGYDGKSVKQKHRDLAHQAIDALGLEFGAVDIGQRKDGSLVVLEVNRAPGIEGGTIGAYADALREFLHV
jgi:hypothetical protein